jgi:predicted acetyltransferase/GNAT superfamily N-acetyltransferase
MEIRFEKAKLKHQADIFKWLEEKHVKEFWDNSEEHKNDILNFLNGRKEASAYLEGRYSYWIGLIGDTPFSLIMTVKETIDMDREPIKNDALSKTGRTYSIDYMIGNTDYVGKGLAAKTLSGFIEYFRKEIDIHADVFFIDPDSNNPKALHVYEKAGFKHAGDFIMSKGIFAGSKTEFLIKEFAPNIKIIPATLDDYPIVQDLARFYVYEMSNYCGFISNEWTTPENGLYECFDFKRSFIAENRKAFIIRVNGELTGFVLLRNDNKIFIIDEFFIIAKFQGKGIAFHVAKNIFAMHPGPWELAVIPENIRGLKFWKKTIAKCTDGIFDKELKKVDWDQDQPKRYFFNFNI